MTTIRACVPDETRGEGLTVGFVDICPVDHHHQGRVCLEDVVCEGNDHDDSCRRGVE